ncbi:aldehyde dehydrogenase family protein [Acinetobacter pittii]|uniref:benzaldehyde dehydrogenase n=1 Tax=Acinetobacter pittii TaxID=48296 RepID=UPI0010234660|nr:benzaldehyde dehydrogenase [Acinetobacter pittii]RZG79864.1 aldehyde dehydrogenase family protein [Acinetobacter pittii]RZH57959.1 aldehyde dehydrogenase family protein [Acinetobacter pittii]RZH60547.1 aldehyde dehydrogenase family protein [Acinetobacter pittii]
MHFLNNEIWENKIFNGAWTKAGRSFISKEVATQSELGVFGQASTEDVVNSSRDAKEAQKEWMDLTYQDRINVFENAVRIAEDNAEEIITWLIKESGSLRLKAQFELQLTIQTLKNAMSLPTSDQGTLLPTSKNKLSIAKRVPLGVVGVIAPFNFPLYLSIRAVAPALALGNSVILKPHENTAICSGFVIARIFELAGLPAGVLHVLPGGPEVGEALTLDNNVASIHFTGSTQVGRIIGANAGKTLKKLSLELGGKNSLIILDDADIEIASENILWGAFLHSGQICMSSGKILIHEKIYTEVKKRVIEKVKNLVMGNPIQDHVTLGPLINAQQSLRVESLVKKAIQFGAKLEVGGNAKDVFFEPTVLSDVTKSNPIFAEEIFGPVAVLISFANDAEAIELANDGEYGLSSGIITPDVGRGIKIGESLKVGLLHINDQTVNDETINPFGGMGASGNGTRIGGPANIDEFTQWQWMTIQAEAPRYPF